MTEEEREAQNENIDRLLNELAGAMETGALLTKYIVIMEILDEEGETCIMWKSHKGSSVWDRMGLLQYLMTKQEVALRDD